MRSRWWSWRARSAAPSPARTLAIRSRSSTRLRGGGVSYTSDTAGPGRVAWRASALPQQDPEPYPGEHGEQEGGEGTDQEVLGELPILEGLEPGERLCGDDPADRAVLAEQHEGEGESPFQGADRAAARDVDRAGGPVLVPPHRAGRELQHAADEHHAPAPHVEGARGQEGHPSPPQPRGERVHQPPEELAHDQGPRDEERFSEHPRAGAPGAVHLI